MYRLYMKLLYLALFILLIIIIYEVRCCYKEGLDQPEASVAKSSLVDSLSDIVTSFTSGDKSEKADDSIKIVPGSMIGVTPIRGKGDQPFSFSESKVIDPDAGKAGTGGSSAEDATKSAAQLAIEEKRKLLGDNFLEVDENGPIYDAASYSMHPDTTLEKAIYVCSNNNYKTDDSGETGGWSKKPLDGKPCIGFYNLASNEKQFHILVPCDDDCDQLDVTPLENDLDKMPPEGEVFYPESPNEDVGLVWRQKAVSSDGKALAHGRVDMSDKFKELTEGELIKNAEIAKVSKKGITKTQAFNECGHKKGKIDGNQCIGVIKKKGENKYHYLYKALGEYEPDNNIENAYRRINMDDENVYKKIFKGNPIRGVRAIMGDTMEAKSKAAAESGSDIMSVMKRANELKGASIDETETSVDGPVGTGAGAGGAGGAGGGIVWKSAQEIVKENEEKTGPAPPTRENCEKNIAKRYEGGQFKKSSVNKFLAKRCKSAFPDMYNWWTEQEGYKNLFDESEGVYAAENIQAAKNQCSSLNNCLGLFKREKSDKYNLLEKSGLNYGIGKPDPSIEKIWLNENLNKKLDKKWETNVKREAKRLKFLVNEVTETKKILNEYEIDKKIEYSKVTGSIEGDDEALYNSLNECNQNKFPENAGEVPEGTLCKGVYKEKDKYNFYFLSEGGEEDVLHRPEKIEKVWRHKINYNVSNSSIIVKRMEEYLKKMKEEIMVAAKTAFDKRNREKLQKEIINSEYQIKQINDEMEKLN